MAAAGRFDYLVIESTGTSIWDMSSCRARIIVILLNFALHEQPLKARLQFDPEGKSCCMYTWA